MFFVATSFVAVGWIDRIFQLASWLEVQAPSIQSARSRVSAAANSRAGKNRFALRSGQAQQTRACSGGGDGRRCWLWPARLGRASDERSTATAAVAIGTRDRRHSAHKATQAAAASEAASTLEQAEPVQENARQLRIVFVMIPPPPPSSSPSSSCPANNNHRHNNIKQIHD